MRLKQDYKSRFRILKGGKVALVISALMGVVTLLDAAPSGENIVSGGIIVDRNTPNTTNINQSTHKGIINWQSFDVNTNEIVNFNMPNSSSSILNRVVSNKSSSIYGKIKSNGQVFLVNQNGIYFGENSKINTAGFIASTLDITNENFLNDNYIFEGSSNASILNLGAITTDNTYTALLAKEVINEGIIQARLGSVQLASGEKITLDINGNSLVKLTIDKGTLDSLVENKNLIKADDGTVYLTTKALNEVLNGVVNNSGIIEANSIEEKDGKIVLFAHGGTANIAGTISAKDGFVETSAKEFYIEEYTKITAGHWLLDPVNITIDSALATTLEGQLESGDATVTTAGIGVDEGDINVNSSIAWSANILTLHADNDININATLDATSTAGLALKYAQTTPTGTYSISAPVNLASTGSFSTKKGKDAIKNYTIITTATNLQGINEDLTAKYVLGADIDASATSTWNSNTGFASLGDRTTEFTGELDGLGHTISALFIDRGDGEYIGLFGHTKQSLIQNIGLLNVNISGLGAVGGLVGSDNGSSFSNVYVTGEVKGSSLIGGLMGFAEHTTLSNAHSTADIIGSSDFAGGLMGRAYSSNISNSYATGVISGNDKVGGLIGRAGVSNISNVYATGEVLGENRVGGLIGTSVDINIHDAYTTGVTRGDFYVGGLIGWAQGSTISNTYTSGAVSGTSTIGGLVGVSNSSSISNSYARGLVSGTRGTGGLAGDSTSEAIVSNSFWDKDSTGQTTSGSGTGKTTAQMQDINTFIDGGWDIAYVENSRYVGFPYAGLTMGGDTTWQIGKAMPPTQTTNYENIIYSILRDSGNTQEIKEMFMKNNNLMVILEDNKQLRLSKASDFIKLALFPNRYIELFNGGLKLPDGLNPYFSTLGEEN